jgi:PIN domain nuclease of toxin-antitoxin system
MMRAAIPPPIKKIIIAKRYRKQIRLWSVDVSHDQIPVFQLR